MGGDGVDQWAMTTTIDWDKTFDLNNAVEEYPDIREEIDAQFAKQREELLDQVEKAIGENEPPPKLMKQVIWGGESGLGSTTIESPNIFAEYNITGRNNLRAELRQKLSALRLEASTRKP